MTESVVEVERKYEVGPDAEVPDLTDLPEVHRVERVTHSLEATYLDTVDLRLRAAATTLRRRTGGSDAGWHLKLPYGPDREEVRAPLGRAGQVPEELAGLVRSRTRGAELAPVARLRTTREAHRLLADDGTLLAEVVDDRVRGTAEAGADGEGAPAELVWREWEAELGAAPRALLDAMQERLLAAGATPSGSASKVGRVLAARPVAVGRPGREAQRPASSRKAPAAAVVQAHLREQQEELVVRDPQVRRDRPDAVHRMRVATRRLRSALQTFRPLLERERTDPLRGELAWLAGVLGAARDAEVMHERLRALVAGEDPELVVGPVADRVDTEMSRRYRQAHDAVLRELDGERYLRLLDALEGLVADPPFLPAARQRARDVLPRLVRRADRRLRHALDAAGEEPGDERDAALHEARKDAKRARYAAEAVLVAAGDPARAYAKAVTRLQEVLGEHQDGVVTRGVLRELADAATAAGESAFTYGRLHAREQERAAGVDERRLRTVVPARRLRRWLRSGSG